MRPKSISMFETLFFVSIGLGIVNTVLNWSFAANALGAGTMLFVQIGTLAIIITLVLLVSRRASNFARWTIVVLFCIGLVQLAMGLPIMIEINPVTTILALVIMALQGLGIACTFREDARPWFRKEAPQP